MAKGIVAEGVSFETIWVKGTAVGLVAASEKVYVVAGGETTGVTTGGAPPGVVVGVVAGGALVVGVLVAGVVVGGEGLGVVARRVLAVGVVVGSDVEGVAGRPGPWRRWRWGWMARTRGAERRRNGKSMVDEANKKFQLSAFSLSSRPSRGVPCRVYGTSPTPFVSSASASLNQFHPHRPLHRTIRHPTPRPPLPCSPKSSQSPPEISRSLSSSQSAQHTFKIETAHSPSVLTSPVSDSCSKKLKKLPGSATSSSSSPSTRGYSFVNALSASFQLIFWLCRPYQSSTQTLSKFVFLTDGSTSRAHENSSIASVIPSASGTPSPPASAGAYLYSFFKTLSEKCGFSLNV